MYSGDKKHIRFINLKIEESPNEKIYIIEGEVENLSAVYVLNIDAQVKVANIKNAYYLPINVHEDALTPFNTLKFRNRLTLGAKPDVEKKNYEELKSIADLTSIEIFDIQYDISNKT